MTAKEIAERWFIGIHDRDEFIEQVQEYARQKCRQQHKNTRHSCIDKALELFADESMHGECGQHFIDVLHGKLMNTKQDKPKFD